MPFSPEETPLSNLLPVPTTYTLRLRSTWVPPGSPWPDEGIAELDAAVTITFGYEDGSAGAATAETSDGAGAMAEADSRVLDLLNLLNEALEGSDWTATGGRKTTTAYQTFEADEPPVE